MEEHFYLVWPAVIFFFNRKGAIVVSIACILLGSCFRLYFVLAGNKLAPYVLTPCRMDSLASGALISLASRGPEGIIAIRPAMIAIGVIAAPLSLAVAFWRHSIAWDPVMQIIGLPLLTCAYASLVAMSSNPALTNPLQKILEQSFLRAFGKYSYGIYVFHGAVAAMVEKIPGFPVQRFPQRLSRANDVINFVILLSSVSFAVAFVSWHLYEKHFLRLKHLFDYTPRRCRSGEAVVAGGGATGFKKM